MTSLDVGQNNNHDLTQSSTMQGKTAVKKQLQMTHGVLIHFPEGTLSATLDIRLAYALINDEEGPLRWVWE